MPKAKTARVNKYLLPLQVLIEYRLALVKTTEAVDLFLVLAADFGVF